MRNILGTFLMLAASVLYNENASSDQLVDNSNFEVGFTGTCGALPNGQIAVGWTRWLLSGNPDYCRETTNVHSQTQAQEIGKDSSAFKAGVKQQVSVVMGSTYTATVWIYATSNESGDFNVERGIVIDLLGRNDQTKIDAPGESGNFVSNRKWDNQLPGGQMGVFKDYTVTFTATMNKITVFTWIYNKWNFTTHSVHDDCVVNGAPPVVVFLTNQNARLHEDTESLQVSQEVTNSPEPVNPTDGAAGFATADGDVKNFRIEVFDPAAAGQQQVTVTLDLRRQGQPPFQTHTLTLNNVDGAGRFRGVFHRFVTDLPDKASVPDAPEGRQAFELLDKSPSDPPYEAKATYGVGSTVIPVCRPKTEDNNDPSMTQRHDTREVTLRFHSYVGSGMTESTIISGIKIVNDRLWQAGIQVAANSVTNDNSLARPPNAFEDHQFNTFGGSVPFPSPDEQEVIGAPGSTNDQNANTVDIWVLPSDVSVIGTIASGQVRAFAVSYLIDAGATYGNTTVIRSDKITNPYTLSHEMMHILLNSDHRIPENPHSLLSMAQSPGLGVSDHVGGRKRIGDFVGWAFRTGTNPDFVEMRRRAEQLAQP